MFVMQWTDVHCQLSYILFHSECATECNFPTIRNERRVVLYLSEQLKHLYWSTVIIGEIMWFCRSSVQTPRVLELGQGEEDRQNTWKDGNTNPLPSQSHAWLMSPSIFPCFATSVSLQLFLSLNCTSIPFIINFCKHGLDVVNFRFEISRHFDFLAVFPSLLSKTTLISLGKLLNSMFHCNSSWFNRNIFQETDTFLLVIIWQPQLHEKILECIRLVSMQQMSYFGTNHNSLS